MPSPERQDAIPGEEVLPASPLRVGHHAGLHPEDMPTQSGPLPRRAPAARVAPSTGVRRASNHASVPLERGLLEGADLCDTEDVPWRTGTSVVVRHREPQRSAGSPKALVPLRTHTPAPLGEARPTSTKGNVTQQTTQSATRLRSGRHRLLSVGVGMLVMIGLVVLLSGLPAWWHHLQDDWRYGYPRTFQMDAVVGHGDSPAHPSHFIALNLHGQIEVIELPGGDPTHAHIYVSPRLYDALGDQAPVTLSFVDRNHDGKPEMDLLFEGVQVRWLNNGTTFVPQRG